MIIFCLLTQVGLVAMKVESKDGFKRGLEHQIGRAWCCIKVKKKRKGDLEMRPRSLLRETGLTEIPYNVIYYNSDWLNSAPFFFFIYHHTFCYQISNGHSKGNTSSRIRHIIYLFWLEATCNLETSQHNSLF